MRSLFEVVGRNEAKPVAKDASFVSVVRFSSLDCLRLNPIAPIRHHINEEPVTGAKCRPGIFSCAGNRRSILTCDYMSYTRAGSSCETSIRRKVGGEGNGGVCMCAIVCVSV